jgi:hypothetical protein
MPTLRAVCPPNANKIPSGRSIINPHTNGFGTPLDDVGDILCCDGKKIDLISEMVGSLDSRDIRVDEDLQTDQRGNHMKYRFDIGLLQRFDSLTA